jgi:hypothetical protein
MLFKPQDELDTPKQPQNNSRLGINELQSDLNQFIELKKEAQKKLIEINKSLLVLKDFDEKLKLSKAKKIYQDCITICDRYTNKLRNEINLRQKPQEILTARPFLP